MSTTKVEVRTCDVCKKRVKKGEPLHQIELRLMKEEPLRGGVKCTKKDACTDCFIKVSEKADVYYE